MYAKHLYFMRLALAEAKHAYQQGEVPVGAIVAHGEKIIARAHNQVEQLRDATAHAEMLALTTAFNALGSKYLPECTLYVTLEPCLMCLGAIYWSKLAGLVWGASDPRLGYTAAHSTHLLSGIQVQEQVLATDSQQLIKTFFATLRPCKHIIRKDFYKTDHHA